MHQSTAIDTMFPLTIPLPNVDHYTNGRTLKHDDIILHLQHKFGKLGQWSSQKYPTSEKICCLKL